MQAVVVRVEVNVMAAVTALQQVVGVALRRGQLIARKQVRDGRLMSRFVIELLDAGARRRMMLLLLLLLLLDRRVRIAVARVGHMMLIVVVFKVDGSDAKIGWS